MTIRIGANAAADQMYVGIQSGSTLSQRVASGTLSFRLSLAATSNKRLHGSSDLTLPVPVLTLVPVHPVRRRGPGTVSLGNLLASGTVTRFGHIDANGTVTLAPSIQGTGLLHRMASGEITLPFRLLGVAENNGQRFGGGEITFAPVIAGDAIVHQLVPAAGDLPLVLAIAGAGLRHAYITGSGELIIGPLSMLSGELAATTQIIEMEGTFFDPDLEGTFIDTIQLEGLA